MAYQESSSFICSTEHMPSSIVADTSTTDTAGADPGDSRAAKRVGKRRLKIVSIFSRRPLLWGRGTYLDGTRIDVPTPLRNGALIRVGGTTLRFETGGRG